MNVDYLDDALPAGLSTDQLGESTSGHVAHLISLHPSPLTAGQVNGYITLVPNGGSQNYAYKWTIRKDETGSAYEMTFTTKTGRIHWRPPMRKDPEEDYKISGNYIISVAILGDGDEVERPLLKQYVQPRNADLEALKNIPEKLVPAGNLFVFRRIICDLLPYISSSAADTTGRVSERDLASLIYGALTSLGSNKRSESLGLQRPLKPGHARSMSGGPSPRAQVLSPKRLRGVCRLDPALVAGHLELIDVSGSNFNMRDARKAYNALEEADKMDVANRLRFPKQNIGIATALLLQHENRWLTESSRSNLVAPADTEADTRIAILAALLQKGDITQLKRNTKQTKSHFVVGKLGFASKVSSAYRLPAMKVFVEKGEDVQRRLDEWEQAKGWVKERFRGGFVQYFFLAPFYRDQENIDDLLGWIQVNIDKVTFRGLTRYVNVAIRDSLEQVDRGLPDDVVVRQFGGFSPRRIAGSKKLSNHARGMAVDFDQVTNPHIFKQHVDALRSLAETVGVRFVVGEESSFDELQALNEAFMAGFVRLGEHVVPRSGWIWPVGQVWWDFVRYWNNGRGGLMTLRGELVDLMKEHGFGWGGEYSGSRDFMHFDYPPER